MRTALAVILAAASTAARAEGPRRAWPPQRIDRQSIPADMPPDLRALVERLYSHYEKDVVEAIRAIGAMGPAAAPAAPFLGGLMDSGAMRIPDAAIAALRRIGRPALDTVVVALQTGDRHAQARACELLAELRDARAIPALVAAAGNSLVGWRALRALERFGPQARSYVLAKATEADPAARQAAVRCLAAYADPNALAAATDALRDADAGVRDVAIDALSGLLARARQSGVRGLDAARRLAAALAGAEPKVRRRLLGLLADEGGPAALEAVLSAARGDADAAVRLEALGLLGRFADERASTMLAEAIKSPDALVRSTAAAAMGRSGNAAHVAALEALLNDKDPQVRERAVGALGRLGGPRAATELLAAINDDDALVRSRAAWALGLFRDARAIVALGAALGDADKAVRLEATMSLALYYSGSAYAEPLGHRQLAAGGDVPLRDARVARALAAAPGDQNTDVRRLAAGVLANVKEPFLVEPMLKLLKDRDAFVRMCALGYLGGQKLDSLAPLREALDDPNPSVRTTAMGVLSRLDDRASIPKFIESLRGDWREAQAAVEALSRFGDAAAEPIAAALGDLPRDVRPNAMYVLARLEHPAARKASAAALADRDEWVRRTAAGAVLRAAGPKATPETLAAVVRADPAAARGGLAYQFAGHGAQAAAALSGLLRDPDAPARLAAVEVLARMRDPAGAVLLTGALGDREAMVRLAAVNALAARADAGAAAPLRKAVGDASPAVRAAAVEAIGRRGGAGAAGALAGALKDPDWDVRATAAQALGKLADANAVAPLAAGLRDAHWHVRRCAADALGALGARSAVPYLAAALADEHWYVARSAQAALERISGAKLGRDADAWMRRWKAHPAPTTIPAAKPPAPASSPRRRRAR